MAIESAQPLRLLVRAGSIAFNFPAGTDFVIVTPQLEIRPGPDLEAVSGVIAALPEDDQDIVQTRNGLLDVLERQEHGALRRVEGGQLLVASLVPTFSIPVAEPSFALPQAQTQIAQFQAVEGDVFLTRFQTTLRNRVDAPGVPLFSGDEVTTLQGKADVLFTDQSLITLDVGTTVVIEEQQQPTGILRSISQGLGSLWFNIQQVVGTETELTTPTAVAAIRGTEGSQFVPNATQSTHSLNEGVEDITELITGQTVTITDGQIVTAIRGVGFTPIAALLALIPKPGVGVGGGGGGAAGGGAGGGAAGRRGCRCSNFHGVQRGDRSCRVCGGWRSGNSHRRPACDPQRATGQPD